jgi:hypothetical protein
LFIGELTVIDFIRIVLFQEPETKRFGCESAAEFLDSQGSLRRVAAQSNWAASSGLLWVIGLH